MKRFIDIEGIFFQRFRFREVSQVLQHPLDLLEFAFDGSLEAFSILEFIEHLHDQLSAVANVLNRMRDVVNEADGDAPEGGLSLLFSDVLLQLNESVRHVVERVAELAEFVSGRHLDSFTEVACGELAGSASEGHDRIDEAPAPEIADGEHREQCQSDRDFELALKRDRNGKCLGLRLLHDYGPIEQWNARGDAEK